ncbi:MAG: cyclic nucleotide-binding domain-containing protein [Chloroflexota bacterium]
MARINSFKDFNQLVTFIAGQTILRAGNRTSCMCAVREGLVGLLCDGVELEAVPPGEGFGEASMADDGPQIYTAYARSDCTIMLIDRRAFTFLVHETPMFARTFARRSRLLCQVDRGRSPAARGIGVRAGRPTADTGRPAPVDVYRDGDQRLHAHLARACASATALP